MLRNMGKRWLIVLTVSDASKWGYLLVLAQDRSQTTNLRAQGGPYVLGGVGDQLLDMGHDVVKQRVLVEKCAESYAR
jgi:hypothetical protein